MPASARSRERMPSAATRSVARRVSAGGEPDRRIRPSAAKALHRVRRGERDAGAAAPHRGAPRASGSFGTMCAKGSPSETLPSKVRKIGRTASPRAAVGDLHREDRLRLRLDRLPDAELLEHAPRRRRDRRGALVAPARVGGFGVDHLDGEVRRALRDGERRRQPGRAAAGDQDVRLARPAIIDNSFRLTSPPPLTTFRALRP